MMLSPHQPTRDDPMADHSSSPELSSPPKSEESSPPSPSRQPSRAETADHARPRIATIDAAARSHGVEGVFATQHAAPGTIASSAAKNTPVAAAPPVRKYTRKKDPNAASSSTSSTTTAEPKAAKPRAKATKPRTTSASSSTPAQPGAAPRKRARKTDPASGNAGEVKSSSSSSGARQPTLVDLVGRAPTTTTSSASVGADAASATSQNGNNEAISPSRPSFVGVPPAPSTPHMHPSGPARTSGQNYDPIRSANMDLNLLVNPVNRAPPVSPTPPRSANRASASPSISSLIDPPTIASGAAGQPFSQLMSTGAPGSSLSSPAMVPARPSMSSQGTSALNVPGPDEPKAEDQECAARPPPSSAGTAKKEAGTSASSNAPSPKPARQKDAPPPPLPQGNGLLTSALFGGPTSAPSDEAQEPRAPTIVIHVALQGATNKIVNFAKLAEEQYGFNALHPRMAAQRERMARVAAAGAALERTAGPPGSGDEMSLDQSDGEKDVEMGGTEGGADGTKKKRKMKADEYDKDDPFVDDSEMLWEEQAAASKDGFFVYSGPLVPEGEKPVIERADGTVPKRGRGRGRGGSTRGTGSTRGGGTGGGPGSRGGTTIRKPRITKAERAKMEQEKLEREKMVHLAAKPSTYVD